MKSELVELINKLIWEEGIEDCEFIIVDREEENNERLLKGEKIRGIENRFLVTEKGKIPIHRIKKISKAGEILWKS